MRKLLWGLAVVLVVAGNAAAYTRITASSTGNSARWASMPVNYFISQQGSTQIANESEFSAVRAAFQTWDNVTSADVRFEYLGTAMMNAVGFDGVNLVSFADSSTPLSSGTLAVTLNFFSPSTGITSEADILFNPNQPWSTSGEAGRFDIQSVMTHEIGHLLGLDHSGMVSSVMTPFGSPGQVDQRTLQYDDIAAVTEVYPLGSPNVGSIAGRILNAGQPLFGAHVVAVDSSGTAMVSTLSGTDGSYTIRFLPPGNYRVYAEPLDGPVSDDNLGGYYQNAGIFFGTTWYPNASTHAAGQVVQVNPGSPAAAADIQLLPKSSTNLNITRPSFAPRLARGTTQDVTLGGFDLSNGVVFSHSALAADVAIGPPTFGSSSSITAPTNARLSVTISGSAQPGPKVIAANRGSDAAVGSGVFIVVDRQPSITAVNPANGPAAGQTRVTITGTNFRPGAQVYFGGIPSTDVGFVSAGLLDVLTPANIPGPATILVVNADGTNRVGPAFTYQIPPPVVSSVSPLSGPPATIVTIDGANFDNFGAEVFFNGVSARVISATSTRIVTAVPFGATSGPVSVVSFGNSAVGPAFTVTEPVPSLNVAPASYSFTDASTAAGGAALTMSNNDDGSAQVALPFTFSLFQDIYPAESSITVTTNGFLSLESGVSPEFQNGPLPGASAQKAASAGCFTTPAEIRSLPRALIAPFFDDLVMIPAVSAITTRTVGEAPNRRFIVQWSKLSVLDESGCDLNASVSFQAVLFEGSYDVQFLYQPSSGPRSDASSATIGMQNSARIMGVQTSFNQPAVGPNHYINYRFQNGQYTVIAPDVTPPSIPVVLDGGTTTNSASSLSASWTSDDTESGIREYQYAVGTTPGGADVVAFTTTSAHFAVVNGLSLTSGATYYFAVRAVNNDGLVSAAGVSDGIRIDSSFAPETRVIPFTQQDGLRYTGIALLAASATTVTFRAVDNGGTAVTSTTVSLNPGQQYAKLISEIFGFTSFDGWIEIEPSAPGLGVFAAIGSWDNRDLDGIVPRSPSTGFVAMHADATLWLVNPSTSPATATLSGLSGENSVTLEIPARGRVSAALSGVTRITSTRALSAAEVIEGPGRLALSIPEPMQGDSALTFVDAAIGGEYSSFLTLVNVGSAPANATISFIGATHAVQIAPSSSVRLDLSSVFPVPAQVRSDALRVTTSGGLFSSAQLVGVVDIFNPLNAVALPARSMSMEFRFPHVAQGEGFFTGIVLAAGAEGATVTVDVYTPAGDIRRSDTVTLGSNEQVAAFVSQLVSSVTTQLGGYLRIRSTRPILAWEVYGTDEAFASGPPL